MIFWDIIVINELSIYLTGTLTGIAIPYTSGYLTDKRREEKVKNAKKEAFLKCKKLMQELFSILKEEIDKNPSINFFRFSDEFRGSSQYEIRFDKETKRKIDNKNLIQNIKKLETNGFCSYEEGRTGSGIFNEHPKVAMTEEFMELLKNDK